MEVVYEVEGVTIDHWIPRRYPKYKVNRNIHILTASLKEAEAFIAQYVLNMDYDFFCFYVYKRPLCVESYQMNSLEVWLYDQHGVLLENRPYSTLDNKLAPFNGRNEKAFRWKPGDIVEILYDGEVELALLYSPPLTRSQYVEIYNDKSGGFLLDASDDNAIVITSHNYCSHMHLSTLIIFQPHYPIPDIIRQRFEKMWETFKDSCFLEEVCSEQILRSSLLYPLNLHDLRQDEPKELFGKGNQNLLCGHKKVAIYCPYISTEENRRLMEVVYKEVSSGSVIISCLDNTNNSDILQIVHDVGGMTIGVAANSLDNCCPLKCQKLMISLIKNNGLVLSEYGEWGTHSSSARRRASYKLMVALADEIYLLEKNSNKIVDKWADILQRKIHRI